MTEPDRAVVALCSGGCGRPIGIPGARCVNCGGIASSFPASAVQAVRSSEASHADLRAARDRLALARRALVADGYFTPDEVGDDIAPRISELTSWLRDRLKLTTFALEQAMLDRPDGAVRQAGLEMVAENRRRLAGGGAGAPTDAEMALRERMGD